MPKPVKDVDHIYIKHLLSSVTKEAKLSLTSNSDFYKLQANIERAIHSYISISTLKRLFGKNATNKPTEASLDICAKYVGIDSWQTYLNNARQFDKYAMHHELSVIIVSSSINIDRVLNLCRQFGHSPEIQPFVFNLIRIAAEQRKSEFFEDIFILPNVFNKKYHSEYDFYYLGQAIALVMRTDAFLCRKLTSVYASNALAQQYLIESFVDEDNPNNYYSKLLQEYVKYKSTLEAKVFFHAVMYKLFYQENKRKLCRIHFAELSKLNPVKKVFKIVEARYIAIVIIEEKQQPNQKSGWIHKRLLQVATKRNGFYVDYYLYLLRYLFMAKVDSWIAFLTKLYDKYPVTTNEHWLTKSFNLLKLYLAYGYHLSGDADTAAITFQSVETSCFDPFMYRTSLKDYHQIGASLKKSSI